MSRALPGWESAPSRRALVVGVLFGEGIGPEVVSAALDVLGAVADTTGRSFDVRVCRSAGAGGEASGGCELTPEVEAFCETIVADGGALLCGPGGGRFVYDLRARFELYCKLTPIVPFPALAAAGVLRAYATDGIDIVVVRENRGGIYFGAHDFDRTRRTARHDLVYGADEVGRLLDAAARIARARARRLAVVVKSGGLPSLSALWREEAERVCRELGLQLEILDIDNAAYELIARPEKFDVIAAPNLFGDVLSDLGAVLLRSRGMSYSGNFGANGVAAYQTGHGAARDLAGADRANPLGQIQSVAMMLRESFRLDGAADVVMTAIGRVLAAKLCTADIALPDATVIGTREMGARVAQAVRDAHARSRLSA